MGEAAKESGVRIVEATTPAQIEQVRALFLEYAQSLGFSLCFQSFDKELAELPGEYAPPGGRLLLAMMGGEAVGCVALHRIDGETCEMKRLYLCPRFRGGGAGRMLAERLIAEAVTIGYKKMRLDSVAGTMDAAISLYRRLGFRQIPPYRANPVPGALYMELSL